MFWARKAVRALLGSALLTTVGCCYHAQHFGKTRDIGIGEVGCATCVSSCDRDCHDRGCHDGGCDPKGRPISRAELVQGNTVISLSQREPRGVLSRLRDRIEARKAERVELLVPQETYVAGTVLQPLPVVTTAGQGVTPIATEPPLASAGHDTGIAPVVAVTPPLQPTPAAVPIRDVDKK
jgi:hypothetical protein